MNISYIANSRVHECDCELTPYHRRPQLPGITGYFTLDEVREQFTTIYATSPLDQLPTTEED